VNIRELLATISKLLPGDTPELDSQVLLAHILEKPRTWIIAHPEAHPTKSQIVSIEEAVSRLETGEPLPYLLGHWEFFGIDLELTPAVLIPRPETELLVERAIEWLSASQVRRTVADVGTGSGCIAIAIAKHFTDANIIATDISYPALEVAQRNARRHNLVKQIDFIQCDLLPPHPDSLPTELHFDLICANLPYIPTDTLHKLSIYGHEPALALDGGMDGLDIVRRLIKVAPAWLAPNGLILLEIETSQGISAVSLAYDAFDSAEIQLHRDLSGKNRLVEIRL